MGSRSPSSSPCTCAGAATALVQRYATATLAGALVGSLALDGRQEDAMQLARLFTEIHLGTGGSDVDTPVLLAILYDTGPLAGALVRRLSLDGRTKDAQRLAVLFTANNIGTAGDFGHILPRA
jgi:hypothetical protein